MALKNRRLKAAVAAMAIISVITSGGLSNVYADSSSNEQTTIERSLENRTYTVKNNVLYIKDGQVSDSGADKIRNNISEDTLIEVIDGKIYMTVEFTQAQYSMIDNVSISVDGNTQSFERSESRKYRVEIGRLDSDIRLFFDVNIPVPGMPPHSFETKLELGEAPEVETNTAPTITAKDVTINVGNSFDALSGATANDKEDGDLTSSINVVSNNVDTTKAGSYAVTYEVSDSKGLKTTKTINVVVSEKAVEKPNTLEDGIYKITNKTTYSGTSSIGSSMVRSSLEETSYIESKDGKFVATLEFADSLYPQMSNIKITVDGKSVTTTEDKSTGKVSFEVPSINSKIGVSAFISAMGSNISYAVDFEESSMEKIASGSTGGTTSDSTTNDSNNSGSNSNDSSSTGSNSSSNGSSSNSSSENTTTESTVKKGKLYTIQNAVEHSSQTGKEMARKYLNSTSKVEEIDGQKYITLTFSGSGFMQNHTIYVNGAKVSHQVTAKSGDTISLRFKVSSLNDTIKVGMYVVPMSKNIDFTVRLLEDTLTFVKDYEVSSEDGTSLPQTGSAIDNTMLVGTGSALMALAGVLNKRKRK
ncbi:DUF5011 domain-containing protein [Romboutsia weinsteinii]|uniref:DUF5011 domain-containing protein n=1 Tax=Romboutsia weinsteinii TaxID=2020949 RepID=A0A371IYC1_9FIRM|nr:NEAT domain-containing protein [Romboutsia weinsteinii]RDY25469.1 DUF5011 domain-containing protein [Romboutsia weinsteinii]